MPKDLRQKFKLISLTFRTEAVIILDIRNAQIFIRRCTKNESFEKILKVFAIIAAIAGAAAAIYFAIQKLTGGKSAAAEDDFENYVSCSCCDDDFISETVA